MFRSSVLLGQHLTTAEVASAAQQTPRRIKTFIRKLDENNKPYYVLNRYRRRVAEDATPRDLFEVSDALLDLDAEGYENVRSYSEADEKAMGVKWAIANDPVRKAVRTKVKALKKQLHQSRAKADSLLLRRIDVQRVTAHDVFSAALRGAPAQQRFDQLLQRGSDEGNIDERQQDDAYIPFMDNISAENGIPERAKERDDLFMQWMLLRHKQLDDYEGWQKTPPSLAEFKRTLHKQTLVAGVRRLVFQYLSAGTALASPLDRSTQHSPGTHINFSLEIRNSCSRIMQDSSTTSANHLQMLMFIGNVLARLPDPDTGTLVRLLGLGLMLSAQTCEVQATTEYLRRATDQNMLDETGLRQDVDWSLATFTRMLGKSQEQLFHSAHNRQSLFDLAVGVDEEPRTSFRAAVLLYLGGDSRSHIGQAFKMFASYILLLGHLGAIKTLWRDWQTMAPMIMDRIGADETEGVTLEAMTAAFEAALIASIRVAGQPNDLSWVDLSLDECAESDYTSIEEQDAGNWHLDLADGGETTLNASSEKLLESARSLLKR